MKAHLCKVVLALLVVHVLYAREYNAGFGSIEFEPQIEPDTQRKSREIRRLTTNAVKHLIHNSLEVACNDFVHNATWRKGELFVFVFNQQGIVLAHGDDTHLIWQDISYITGLGGKPLIEEMLSIPGNRASISYLWQNAFKSAYIEKVKKNGMTYIVGSGFYPEGDEYTTKQLVKTAVAYFNQNGREAAFALMSNPKGPFNRGDVYMFAYDFDGVSVAHGQNGALIGQNLIDLVDSRGKYLIKDLINTARTKGSGWVDYYWRNEFKRSWVERVIDPKTKKSYLISAGYYPYITLKTVVGFVKKAIAYLKSHGSKDAFTEFSNQVGKFARAGLGIYVLDLKGNCLANGENPSLVGQNLLKIADSQGKFYIKNIINTARKYGKGLVSFYDYNTQGIAYVELVKIPEGTFVIAATYYPDSKLQSTQTLVNKALDLLHDSSPAVAFEEFSKPRGDFVRGDLHIFVYDTKGTRLVNNSETAHIWENFSAMTDQDGKHVISSIIQTAANGGGWIDYKVRSAQRRVYVKAIEKLFQGDQPRTFIVGSGYFL